MVYTLPKGGAQWLWTIWLWAVGITTFIPLIGIMNGINLAILPFAALVCIAFTGAWPLFQQETKRWHYVSAILCGILSQVCVAIINYWWLAVWIIGFLLIGIIFGIRNIRKILDTKGVFIAEVICYITLIGVSL